MYKFRSYFIIASQIVQIVQPISEALAVLGNLEGNLDSKSEILYSLC